MGDKAVRIYDTYGDDGQDYKDFDSIESAVKFLIDCIEDRYSLMVIDKGKEVKHKMHINIACWPKK